jgi:dolichol kinase
VSKEALEMPAIALVDATPIAGTPAAPVRAANATRSIFHVASGAFSLALLRFLPTRTWIIAVAATFMIAGWGMEAARRSSPAVNNVLMKVFAPVAHPHERHGINSSTWYTTALLLLGLFAPLRAAEIGVLVLAVADPAAGLVGRRFGRTRIRAGRSLEGTLGFFVVGGVAAACWLSLVHAMAWPAAGLLAAAAAAVGALTELGSTKLDDNFTIPVATAAAAAVVAATMLPGL